MTIKPRTKPNVSVTKPSVPRMPACKLLATVPPACCASSSNRSCTTSGMARSYQVTMLAATTRPWSASWARLSHNTANCCAITGTTREKKMTSAPTTNT